MSKILITDDALSVRETLVAMLEYEMFILIADSMKIGHLSSPRSVTEKRAQFIVKTGGKQQRIDPKGRFFCFNLGGPDGYRAGGA